MRMHLPLVAALALLGAAACSRDDQGGNGPGNADGAGGRTDPPTEQPLPSSVGADPRNHMDNTPGTTGNPPGGTTRKGDPDSPAHER